MSETAPVAVALYARVSTDEQADRNTIASQVTNLRTLAPALGYHIAGEYLDDGVSGTIALQDRPGGQALLRDAAAHRFQVVMVYRIDRLARSLTALLRAHELLQDSGVTLRSVSESFDTGTSVGRFIFQILGSMAELERSTILERTAMGKARIVKAGKWPGGVVPLGYDLTADGLLTPCHRPIAEVGMTEAELVADIFQRIANGSTVLAECRRLNALGVSPVRRYKGREVLMASAWVQSRLCSMLRNSVYYGEHVITGKYGTIARAVPSLITQDVWVRTQAQVFKNRSLPTHNASRAYLLHGLVRCGVCKWAYIGGAQSARSRVYHYYRCGSRRHHAVAVRCPSLRVSAHDLEEIVWQRCLSLVRDPGMYLEMAQAQYSGVRKQDRARDEKAIARIRSILSKKDTERERVITMSRKGLITFDEVEIELAKIQEEVKTLREQVVSLESQWETHESVMVQARQVANLLRYWQDHIDQVDKDNDIVMKRQLVETVIKQVRIDLVSEQRGNRVRKRYKVDVAYHI